jgi:hypothetical protein
MSRKYRMTEVAGLHGQNDIRFVRDGRLEEPCA